MLKKSVLSLFLVFVLICSLTITSFATTSISEEKIYEDTKKIASKYNIELKKIDENQVPLKTIEVNSLQEFEELLANFNNLSEEFNNNSISEANPTLNYFSRAASRKNKVYNDIHTWKQWVPFTAWGLGGVTSTRVITYNYKWKYNSDNDKEFVEISNIDSSLDGIDFVYWSPKGDPAINYNSQKDKVSIKIVGQVICGIEVIVKGVKVPVGAYRTQTWKMSHSL